MINIQSTLVSPDIYELDHATGGAPYDAKAKIYEWLVGSEWYNRFAWGTSPSDYRRFASLAMNETAGLILDIGCGGLTQTVDLYNQTKRQMILLDNSIEMLQIARRRLIKLSGEFPANIRLMKGDAFQLPFDEQIDNIFSFGMLHLFENRESFLKSIFTSLKKGGQFYISSLTTDRAMSRRYISFLNGKKEMAPGLSSDAILNLVSGFTSTFQFYTRGSMVFVYGSK